MLSLVSNPTKVAVNIGGADGVSHDPVYELYHKLNYSGLVFEGDNDEIPTLRSNLALANSSLGVILIPEFATSDLIVQRLQEHSIPTNLDVLKIDIDSIDFIILRSIIQGNYMPSLICVEINPAIPPSLGIWTKAKIPCLTKASIWQQRAFMACPLLRCTGCFPSMTTN